MDNIDKSLKILEETTEAAKQFNIIINLKDLVKAGNTTEFERIKIINALICYTNRKISRHSDYAVSCIVDLVQNKEKEFAGFFLSCIAKMDSRCYWGIKGYAKVKDKNSYDFLIECIFSSVFKLTYKALAVKCISKISNQPFDLNRPEDPGYWKNNDIDYKAIRMWKEQGFPDGEGYPKPIRHECLQYPTNNREEAYARLDKMLQKKREKKQDLACPSNWLIKAEANDLKVIKKKWSLPKGYLDFLEKASPLMAYFILPDYYGDIIVFGAKDLIEGQYGYSYNVKTKTVIRDWNPHYLVIATRDADPFCIDISKKNSPVYFAFHGDGEWDFSIAFKCFDDFLQSLEVELN